MRIKPLAAGLLVFGGAFAARDAHAAVAWPLKVSADSRYLVDQNNVPFVPVIDSPWNLFKIPLTGSNSVQAYLDDRQAKGFNALVVEVHEYEAGAAVRDSNGNVPFTDNADWSTRVPAYWDYLDSILSAIRSRDMLVILYDSFSGYGCNSNYGWAAKMLAQTEAQMTEYGTFLGNRYKATNVIWVEGGDVSPRKSGCNLVFRLKAIRDAIRAADPTSLHTGLPERGQSPYVEYYAGGAGYSLDLHPVYARYNAIPALTKAEYDRSPTRPVLNMENNYENCINCNGGLYIYTQDVITQAWWAFLLGGSGPAYGNEDIWQFPSGWYSHLSDPGAVAVGHLAGFFRSVSHPDLVPDYGHTVVTAGYGTFSTPTTDYVAAGRSGGGNVVVAYIPLSGTTITVDMTKVNGSSVRARWYRASDGAWTDIGSYSPTGSRQFTSPANAQVLLLESASDSVAPAAPTDLRVQ